MEGITIEYKYDKIQEGQFATFEENLVPSKEVAFGNEVGFGYDFVNNVLQCTGTIQFAQDDKPIIKLCLGSFFSINPSCAEKLMVEEGLAIPKGLLIQFASLNYGAMRGVLFEKLKSTSLSCFILPPFFFDTMIKDNTIIKNASK